MAADIRPLCRKRPRSLASLAATVALLGTTAQGLQGCAVQMRYTVPARELAGRELFGTPVRVGDDGAFKPIQVIGVELPEADQAIFPEDENASATLQAAVASQPEGSAILVSDDTKIWPAIVLGAVGGQIGFFAGELMAFAEMSDDTTSRSDEDLAMLLFSRILVGTAIGTGLGVWLGTTLAARPKEAHLAPAVPR